MASFVMWHAAAFFMILFRYSVRGQISYSIPEEMPKGSIVGNISQGLGLDLKRLKSGKARIFAGDNTEFVGLNKERGILLTEEKIDREALCAKTTPCALHLQLILENPMEWYDVTVEIIDINDNAPSFPKGEITFEISESAVIGARFMLENAIDLDVGSNSHLSYSLKPTDNFVLSLQSQTDGDRNMEMVLQNALDRENKEQLSLLLTAVDGGEPQLTSTVRIHVTVLDINDNPPVFNQRVYKATLPENTPKNTVITSVSASDADEGSNAIITYYMSSTGDVNDLFMVDARSGKIILKGSADFEKASRYQLNILHSALRDTVIGKRSPEHSSSYQTMSTYIITLCLLTNTLYNLYTLCSPSKCIFMINIYMSTNLFHLLCETKKQTNKQKKKKYFLTILMPT
uniref:Cadherin domain-containing protein n=1 Tax=Cyprinus carpio TaxID=7962 RepID=A0A8C2BTF9_CYPCA